MAVLLVVLGGMIGQRLAQVDVINATFYALKLGALCILVAHLLASTGAIKSRLLDRKVHTPRGQIGIPVLGAVFATPGIAGRGGNGSLSSRGDSLGDSG